MSFLTLIILVGLVGYIIWLKNKKPSSKKTTKETYHRNNSKSENTKIKYCSECGASLDENALFCAECGAKVKR